MKHIIRHSRILGLTVALAASMGLAAQDNALKHYLGVQAGVGYSRLGLDNDLTTSPGGVGGGLGVFYELEASWFKADVGVGFDLLGNKMKLDDFTKGQAVSASEGKSMFYNYNFTDYSEHQLYGRLAVPMMVGAQFGRYYFLVGGKMGLGLLGHYNAKSAVFTSLRDAEAMEDFRDMPQHNITSYDKQKFGSGSLKYAKPEFALSAEVGVDLDEWLAVKPKPQRRGRPRRKTFRECLHYRASIFADYGLNDIHDFSSNANDISEQALVSVDGAVPAGVKAGTMLGTRDFQSNKLNSLQVGLRFAIQYEFQPKVKRPAPKPKPQPKPQPKPRPTTKPQRPAPQPTMKGLVFDAESRQPLAAAVDVQDMSGKSVYNADVAASGFHNDLKPGTYRFYVNTPGYMPYEQELTFTSDTLYIGLTKIKEGRKIVLHNLFFATNKTTILSESETALNDLYFFLSDNPDVRVRIVGHTDNVGTDAANQKLSEGRAESVRRSMIDRGISADRLEAEGRGESEPIDTNDTEEGRANNRRVEIHVIGTSAD